MTQQFTEVWMLKTNTLENPKALNLNKSYTRVLIQLLLSHYDHLAVRTTTFLLGCTSSPSVFHVLRRQE